MVETTVIIVNWNGVKHLKICLPSLKKQSYTNYELIFVDNGSSDGSVEYVKEIFPESSVIQLKENLGFAKPNNLGFNKAKGKFILTLNNDIELCDNFLELFVSFFKKQKENVYSLNPKIIYYDDKDKINTIGILPLLNGGAINEGKGESVSKYNKTKDIFGSCAGCALYKTNIIKKLGCLFDESYFAYLEDYDLAIRAKLNGYQSKYFPDAICFHKHSATSKQFPYHKFYLIERNRLRNLIKYYPLKYILFEPYYTFLIIKNAKKKMGEGGLSKEQKEILKNKKKIIWIIFKAKIVVFLELPSLLKKRRKIPNVNVFWEVLDCI